MSDDATGSSEPQGPTAPPTAHITPPASTSAGSPPAPGGPTPPGPLGPPPFATPPGGSDGGDGDGRPTMLIVGAVALALVVVVGIIVLLTRGDDGETLTSPDSTPVTEATAVVDETSPSTAPTTPSTDAGSAMTPSAEELARSVVQIIAPFDGGACTGSGTIIDESGLILTNSHVVARSSVCPWETLIVATVDTTDLPPQPLFESAVVVDDPALDLAVIRITGRLDGEELVADFPALEIGDSDDLQLGDRLRVLGFPGIGGETITFTEGTISGFVEQPGLGTRSWMKTDASISGGNSGGLAANDAGQLIGVPTRAGTGGAGTITDCRRVEDTNGDGAIDENDSCIPIGGFINGIRPINVAADIIDAARSAPVEIPETTVAPTTAPPTTAPPETAPPETAPPAATTVTAIDPRFSQQTTDGLPDPEVFVVPDGATQLCLTWRYGNFPAGAPFVFGWNIDGEIDPGSRSEGTNQGAVDGEFFGCVNNDAGLAPGLYEAVWVVNGEAVFTHGIYVGGGRPALTIGVQNNTAVPFCLVQWQPASAVTSGIPHNTEAVAPGERFETVLPAGAYRTRIVDCDGNVVFEDPGTEFATDLTLTLPL